MTRAAAVGLWATAAELERRGAATATVRTGSMRPLVWPGTRVALRRVAPDALSPGDLIVFLRRDGSPCIHRLLGWREGMAVTRGDANPHADPPVEPSRILGRVEGLVVGRVQWRTAPRSLQRALRRALLPALPLLRWTFGAARTGVRGWRRVRA